MSEQEVQVDRQENSRGHATESTPRGRFAWFWTAKTFDVVVTTAAVLIMVLPVGLATVWLGFVKGESPCTLCGYERFGMVFIAVLALFIVRYGPRRKYLVTLVITAAFFLYTTIRHWSIYWLEDAGHGLAEMVLGAHTYTWGVFVFWVVVAAGGIALLWVGRDQKLVDQFAGREKVVKPLSLYTLISGILIFALTIANSVQFFLLTGPPPFAGTGQPARFTLDVGQAAKYWTPSIWSRVVAPTQLHSFTPPMVHVPGVYDDDLLRDAQSAADAAPILGFTDTLNVVNETELGFEALGFMGDGNAGGIAYDEDTGLFGIVSNRGGLYYVEDDFETVQSSAIIDRVNGSNITYTTDATFFGPESLVAVAWNKTIYGTERVSTGEVDPDVAWKEFRETTDDLMPAFGSKNRPKLSTARAKSAFTLSIAFDRDTALYSVVSVPSPGSPDIVVTQFADDNYLERENVLQVSEGLAIEADGDVADYYPVGADIRDGTMYLLSATHQSLLLIDMETVEITEVWEIPEIGDYHSIAVTEDGAIFVLSLDGDRDVVYEFEMP